MNGLSFLGFDERDLVATLRKPVIGRQLVHYRSSSRPFVTLTRPAANEKAASAEAEAVQTLYGPDGKHQQIGRRSVKYSGTAEVSTELMDRIVHLLLTHVGDEALRHRGKVIGRPAPVDCIPGRQDDRRRHTYTPVHLADAEFASCDYRRTAGNIAQHEFSGTRRFTNPPVPLPVFISLSSRPEGKQKFSLRFNFRSHPPFKAAPVADTQRSSDPRHSIRALGRISRGVSWR